MDGDTDCCGTYFPDWYMLKVAGIGVAMGNAGDSLKKVADYVTTTVDDDGIKRALEYFHVI